MQHLAGAAVHAKQSIIGTTITFMLGFIGKTTLSNAALVMGILSGMATFLYTCWKWHADYKNLNNNPKQ